MTILFALSVTNPAELGIKWEQIDSPRDLLNLIQRTFSGEIEITDIENSVVISTDTPAGSDSEKLWVNPSNPGSIGIMVGSTYQMLYPYPPKVPLLWNRSDADIPSYMRSLSPVELQEMGLTAPQNTSKYSWVIFEP